MPKPELVFVIDDDPGVLRSLKRLLKQHGYDCRLFETAEHIESHPDLEDAVCVVLDINLADASGIDVRYHLKAAGIFVPVIYITGRDSPAVRERAMNSGCIAYLTKPFSAMSLIEPIHKVSAASHHP